MKRIIYLMFFACVLSTNVVFAEKTNNVVAQSEVLPIQIEGVDAENQDSKKQVINQFLLTNGKMFSSTDLIEVKKQLESLTPEQIQLLSAVEFLDPTINLVVSVVAGGFGADRFLIGQTDKAILKLVTLGGLGIWWIVDWFQIQDLTMKSNMKKFNENLLLIK